MGNKVRRRQDLREADLLVPVMDCSTGVETYKDLDTWMDCIAIPDENSKGEFNLLVFTEAGKVYSVVSADFEEDDQGTEVA